MEPLFWLGAHRTLQKSDLYSHPVESDSKLLLKQFSRLGFTWCICVCQYVYEKPKLAACDRDLCWLYALMLIVLAANDHESLIQYSTPESAITSQGNVQHTSNCSSIVCVCVRTIYIQVAGTYSICSNFRDQSQMYIHTYCYLYTHYTYAYMYVQYEYF